MIRFVLLTFLLLMAIGVGGGVRWVSEGLKPVGTATSAAELVDIPEGSTTQQVATILWQRRLIKQPLVFRYYARYRKLDGHLKPGEYELSASMNVEAILQKLARGEIVVHRFTVPEGKTVAQIADLLAAKGIVDKERFRQAATASKLSAPYLPEGLKSAQPLEGYLFPDTYEYRSGAPEAEILALMFQRFEQMWTPELRAAAARLGLTTHEAVTFASIVEAEAQVSKERPTIAGVYWNRQRIGMKLDADPTVRYGIGKPPEQELLLSDLTIETPYNTYRTAGLPPGPIGAPGLAAIKAVLAPEQHDFWYFVAKADGSGEHYFATTLDEQEANIVKARENAKP